MDDIVELDRLAVLASLDVVGQVVDDHLARPTPCAGWTARDLLAHMTVQHRGFAAAADGHGADPAVWRIEPGATDIVRAYVESAKQVIAAFAADDVLDREFWLPEISTATPFPARQAIGFHLVDYVVHSWDVARSIGATCDLDPRLEAAALRIARAVPGGPARHAPGAAFGPEVDRHDPASPLDRIVAMLGRSPAWPR